MKNNKKMHCDLNLKSLFRGHWSKLGKCPLKCLYYGWGFYIFIIFGTLWYELQYILSFENFIFVDFLAVKGNGSDVKPGICLVTPRCFNIQTSHGFKNFFYFHQIVPIRFKIKWYIFSMSITVCIQGNTDSWFDVTSVNFNSQKVHEDNIFEQQNILQFLSQGSKYYKYVKSQTMIWALLIRTRGRFSSLSPSFPSSSVLAAKKSPIDTRSSPLSLGSLIAMTGSDRRVFLVPSGNT